MSSILMYMDSFYLFAIYISAQMRPFLYYKAS